MLHILIKNLNIQTRPIVRKIREKRDKNIKLWMERQLLLDDKVLKNASDIKPIEEGIIPDFALYCLLWDVDSFTITNADAVFRYLIERHQQNSSDFWIVLTSDNFPKHRICLFLDSSSNAQYPDEWHKFECVCNEIELDCFCNTHDFALFKLCKGVRFEVANDNFKHIRGAKVFKELSTGNYWYLDTLHKDHIEVFDSFGKKHLGEADLKTGAFDPNKADNSKLPIL